MVTKDFLKDVLQGKKRLLKMVEVSFINPPLFDEISVKRLYNDVVQQPLIKDYFPDEFPKGCQCDRAYFYNVWNTKYPKQVKEAIDHANAQRYTVSNEEAKQNAITITNEW